MKVGVTRVPLAEILPLRHLYLAEMNCQVVHDSFHARGFTDSYLLNADDRLAGYGSVAGLHGRERDVVKEFYVLPEHRRAALPLFRALVESSRARTVEAQTNDRLLTLMLLDCAASIEREKVLFEDGFSTALSVKGAVFRKTTEGDRSLLFAHTSEPPGDRLIEVDGRIVATGGLAFH